MVPLSSLPTQAHGGNTVIEKKKKKRKFHSELLIQKLFTISEMSVWCDYLGEGVVRWTVVCRTD